MAIQVSDILWKYSIYSGTAGNQNPQTVPGLSLGKYISTTVWSGGALHDLFGPITGLQNESGQVDYRCIFIQNNNLSGLTYSNVVVWLTSGTSGGATVTVGADPIGITAIASSGAQSVSISGATIAPSGVTFSSPSVQGSGVALGSIAAQQVAAVWLQRTANNTPAMNNDSITLNFGGDTPP